MTDLQKKKKEIAFFYGTTKQFISNFQLFYMVSFEVPIYLAKSLKWLEVHIFKHPTIDEFLADKMFAKSKSNNWDQNCLCSRPATVSEQPPLLILPSLSVIRENSNLVWSGRVHSNKNTGLSELDASVW